MTKERAVGEAYLKNVRLSFPALHSPKASVRGGPEKYGADLLIDPSTPDGKTALAVAKKAAQEVIEATWPKAGGKFPGKPDRKALKKGDECISQKTGEPYVGYEGMVVVAAKNEDRPTLLTRNKKQPADGDIKKLFYGGCRVEAIVRFYAVTDPDKGGNGLFASLEGVRFWSDDEAFGGTGGVDADAFDDDEGDEDFGEGGDDDLL